MEMIKILEPVIEERSSGMMDTYSRESQKYEYFSKLLEKVKDPALVYELENTYLCSLKEVIKRSYEAGLIERSSLN
ncbi:hypothetical protein D3C75_563370 [compost metagenome]